MSGDVALMPYPAWSMTEAALFHDHGGWATWDRTQAWLADQRTTFLAALIQ